MRASFLDRQQQNLREALCGHGFTKTVADAVYLYETPEHRYKIWVDALPEPDSKAVVALLVEFRLMTEPVASAADKVGQA
jgi:hypothetical protein